MNEDSFLINRFLPLAHSVYYEALILANNNPPVDSSYIISQDDNFIISEAPDYIVAA